MNAPTARTARLALAALAATISLAGGVRAGTYDASQDSTIAVQSSLLQPVTSTSLISSTGSSLFDTQQTTQSTLSGAGVTATYSYVWVCTNGQCVPVDPFTVSK